MTHYLVGGSEARLMSTWRRGDKLVLVWVGDGARWVSTQDILIVDAIAREGVSNPLAPPVSPADSETTLCECHGLVWDCQLVDSRDRCPLSGSDFALQAWADAMSWVSPAQAPGNAA